MLGQIVKLLNIYISQRDTIEPIKTKNTHLNKTYKENNMKKNKKLMTWNSSPWNASEIQS